MLPVECSVADWEWLPELAPLYRPLFTIWGTYSLFTARRKEIGKLWHCSKERARNTCLLCEISFLKYCFVVELFEKWRISPPRMAPQFGDSFWCFGCSILWLPTWEAPNLVATRGGGGGGGLGLPPRGLSPKQNFILIYMTSRLCFRCYILLLTRRFFWYYCSHQVMATFGCVAQKAAFRGTLRLIKQFLR